jgi:hypothetical protein
MFLPIKIRRMNNMANFKITKAKRELIWTKIALMAPSGGGKSYSALRLAKGMAEELSKTLGRPAKILMGNTEAARGRYYANEFDFDIVDLVAPHSPEMYVEFIEYAVEEGYDVLILDSTSHEWEGKGGCLELHQTAGGTYQAWGKVTPRHDKFIQKIADSPIHIIATMRGKDQYEMDKDDKGKTNVKKLGVGAKQRDGFEYEFTSTFTIDQQTHTITSQKDNTHLFENEGPVLLTENHGKKIIQWANSGEGYTPPVRETKSVGEVVGELKSKIVDLCKDLGGAGNEELMTVLKEFDPSGNPNKVKDDTKRKELYEKLVEMKNNKENK